MLELHVVEKRPEMLRRDFQILEHSFADRHARNHDDEFLEPVLPAQLENRPQIHIRLPRARLHFDGVMRAPAARRRIGPQPRLYFLSQVQIVPLLHRPQILQHLRFTEEQPVAHAELRPRLTGEKLRVHRLKNHRVIRLLQRLTVEQLHHRIHGIELIFLLRIELNLHGVSFHSGCSRQCSGSPIEGSGIRGYSSNRAKTRLRHWLVWATRPSQ